MSEKIPPFLGMQFVYIEGKFYCFIPPELQEPYRDAQVLLNERLTTYAHQPKA